MLVQDFKKIVPGVGRTVFRPAMDQDRPLARRRDLKLANQPLRAAPRAPRPRGSSPAQSRRRRSPPARPAGRRVWRAPRRRLPACCADKFPRWRRAGADSALPVELAANVERLVHLRPDPSPMPIASTAPTPASYARISIARAVVCVTLAIEVRMRIDQQSRDLLVAFSCGSLVIQFGAARF